MRPIERAHDAGSRRTLIHFPITFHSPKAMSAVSSRPRRIDDAATSDDQIPHVRGSDKSGSSTQFGRLDASCEELERHETLGALSGDENRRGPLSAEIAISADSVEPASSDPNEPFMVGGRCRSSQIAKCTAVGFLPRPTPSAANTPPRRRPGSRRDDAGRPSLTQSSVLRPDQPKAAAFPASSSDTRSHPAGHRKPSGEARGRR
jgi:hypothetical protein